MIKIVESPAGALTIPLEYEIHLELPESHRTENDAKEMLAEAWAQFWETFADNICSPLGRDGAEPHRLLQYPTKEREYLAKSLSGLDESLSYALPVHPKYLRNNVFGDNRRNNYYSKGRFKYGDGARPSVSTIRRVTAEPKIFRGEWFAAGIGDACNGEGERVRGIVLTLELASFIAEEGSVYAQGLVIAKILGIGLVAPLCAGLLIATFSPDVEKTRAKYAIEKRLFGQTVKCNVKANFKFSRPDLTKKFEERLKQPGAAGICETQSALAALGFSPGELDGKAGANYRRAAKAFAAAWGLTENDIDTPLFFGMIARALTGERPPGK